MDAERWEAEQRRGEPTNDRVHFDMQQANLMRGIAQSQPDDTIGDNDQKLGLKGLSQAIAYRKQNQLEESLKLYQLSIELLLKCVRVLPNDSPAKGDLENKVKLALREAEGVKRQLQSFQQQNVPLTKKNSFKHLSNSIQSAINKKPTPARKRRPPPLTTTSQDAHGQTILSEFLTTNVEATTWDDIAGLASVKISLQEVGILPLTRPELFTGLRRAQNILLYGPPGTGKTMLVRAMAHESQSNLFVCDAASLTSKWMGEAEKIVKRLFELASQLAPSIVFVDELDSVLSSRSSNEHEASRRLKTEFMVQMDGIKQSSSHTLLIACTNCPWDIDSAVLRRFPRRIFVPLPDTEARKALVQHLLKKTEKHSLTRTQIKRLVELTEGYSASDISNIASEAAFGPLRSLGDKVHTVDAKKIRGVSFADFESVLQTSTKSVNKTQIKKYETWKREQQ